MRGRALLTVGVVWTTLCGAAFVSAWSVADLDDVAGFIPTLFVLQLPAFLALASAPEDRPLGVGRTTAVALPAAIVGAFDALFVLGVVLELWLRGVGMGVALLVLAVAVIGAVWIGVGIAAVLVKRPHPDGTRRVLAWFGLANLAGSLVVVALARHRDPALVLLMALPPLWAVPLLAVTRRPSPEPAPVARVIR